MRTVNARIADAAEGATWSTPGQLFDFQCECGEPSGCEGRVLLTLDEYERVRRQRDRFAVVPGHENHEIEDVVELHERFVVVDKRPGYEELVE
jgi:hypothetical protein